MEDSWDQDAPDTPLEEQWMLYPNGTVVHHYHFLASYTVTGRLYESYPFDKPVFVATRRAYGMLPTDVQLFVSGQGITMPQEMDAWTFHDAGVALCPTHKLPGQSTADCGQPGADQCSQMVVMWMRLKRIPSGPVQNLVVPITLVVVLVRLQRAAGRRRCPLPRPATPWVCAL